MKVGLTSKIVFGSENKCSSDEITAKPIKVSLWAIIVDFCQITLVELVARLALTIYRHFD